MFVWWGHCPHSYSLEELWGVARHVDTVPDVNAAAAQARAAANSDEEPPMRARMR